MSDRQPLPRTFWILFAGTLVNKMGSFVAPFLSLYLTHARKLPIAEAGLVVAFWGAGSMLAGPVGGALADRVGRRATMLTAFVLGPAFMLALGLARSPAAIGVLAFALSFVQDLYRPASSAMIADVVPIAERRRAYGLMYWAVNLGFSISPVIAGFLAKASYFSLFAGDAATTLVYAVLIFAWVPESRPAIPRARGPQPGWEVVLQDRVYLSFLALVLVSGIIYGQSFVTTPIVVRAHGVSEKGYGTLIALNGMMIVAFQPIVNRLVAGVRASRALAFGGALYGIGFGMTGLVGSFWPYMATVAIWTIGEMASSPVSSAIAAELAPVEVRGRYQGAYTMAWGSAAFLAPLLGSNVLAHLGAGALWGGCFALGVVMMIGHVAIAPARSRRLGRPD